MTRFQIACRYLQAALDRYGRAIDVYCARKSGNTEAIRRCNEEQQEANERMERLAFDWRFNAS